MTIKPAMTDEETIQDLRTFIEKARQDEGGKSFTCDRLTALLNCEREGTMVEFLADLHEYACDDIDEVGSFHVLTGYIELLRSHLGRVDLID
jgi:hypothetical protein